MFKKIQIDHCYNEDKNFKFMKKLGQCGFDLDPSMVEHPGKAFCKFIIFQSKNKRERAYLEFVHVGKGGKEELTPGLSFSFTENLEKFSKKINKKIPHVFDHKNYQWKENSTDRLPGWNFLSFKKPPIKNLYTWFTEYEVSPGMRKFKKAKTHPNSAYSIHGIKLILTAKSKKNLEIILGKKLNSKTKLSDGTHIYIVDGKKDKFDSIILNCKFLKKAHKFIPKTKIEKFHEFDSLRILNNSRDKKVMWDVVLIQN